MFVYFYLPPALVYFALLQLHPQCLQQLTSCLVKVDDFCRYLPSTSQDSRCAIISYSLISRYPPFKISIKLFTLPFPSDFKRTNSFNVGRLRDQLYQMLIWMYLLEVQLQSQEALGRVKLLSYLPCLEKYHQCRDQIPQWLFVDRWPMFLKFHGSSMLL